MEPPRTKRLRLRPYTLDDAQDVLELFADPYARRFYPASADLDAAEGWIRWNLRNYEEHGFGLWAMEIPDSSDFVGDCGITMQPVDDEKKHEVGYHVTARMRRRGLATEAACACRDWALDVLRVPFVCSIVHPENVASKGVAERIHDHVRPFDREGTPHLLYYTESDLEDRGASASELR